MLPVVGALVGSYVNNKLLKKLSETAMNSYRMRILK
jgi:phage tail tape-measure protein